MVESLVWNKESILNINEDAMYESTGTVTVSNESLVLEAKSSATYDYTFDTTDNILETSDLQFILNVINSNTTVSSRYDESVQVETYIKYYEKQVDNSGNITGYILGNTDTYQINPYFRHESEGYTDTYEVSVEKNYTVELKIKFINNSDNTVTFVNPRIFNSMSVMDAIDEYGGGQSGGDTPPLIDALTLYSLEEKYTIDTMNGSLTLQVYIPDEYVNKHKYKPGSEWRIDIKFKVTKLSGDILYYNNGGENIWQDFTLEDGTKSSVFITNGRYTYAMAGGNGKFRVRAELDGDSTIYAERDITVTNNNVTDMQLIIDSASGKIDGNEVLSGRVKILPEMTRSGPGGAFDDVTMTVTSYDGGDATITSGGGDLGGGVIPFTIIGRTNGKVKITVTTIALSTYSYQKLFPSGFTKEFIVDVVNVTGHVFVDTPDGTVLDNTKEYIDLILTTNYGTGMNLNSFSVQSLDGNGKAAASKIINEDYKAGLRIYALNIGKVKVSGYISSRWVGLSFNDYFEQEIDITGLYKELTTEITTNTGLFEITQGDGQLEVYCTPNYSYAGDYSFSQASIDGGSVSINDKGNYALITADREGKLNLICKPTYGQSKQVEITISGQYPKDVQLTTPDNADMIVVGGQLTITGTPGKPYSTRYYGFKWIIDKINPEVDYNSTSNSYSYVTITGKGLGLIRVNCYNYYTNEFLASRIFKVVQSIGSIEVKLPYPDTKTNWVLFRRRDKNNKLFLGTLNGEVTKCIYSGTSIDYDITMTQYSQYYINIDGKTWENYGDWTNDKNLTGQATELIASSINVYDSNDNLIMTATQYETIDFANIIYGTYTQKTISLKTDKDTVFTNNAVKVEALNSDDTVAYDWQFVGTDVTVVEKTNRYVIFKSTSSGNLKVNYILSESGNIITGTDLKVIDKPTNLKYIRLYITKAYRNSNTVGYCNMSELDILDSNGNSVLTDGCVYTADSVYSGSSDVPANAFDKNTSTIWHSADSSNAHWIQIEFASGIDLPSSYVITRRTDGWNDYLASWELQASTDGSTWLTLDKHTDDTNWASGYSRTFSIQ